MKRVHVFWDNSNIFIGAQAVLLQRHYSPSATRISFKNLLKVAAAGRQIAGAHCVGSIPPDLKEVWKQLEKETRIRPELFERGAELGREQAVNQAHQVQMLRALSDEPEPQIAVLLTGDGHGYRDGVGFHADLERMHQKGWEIEVISWDLCCASALKKWAEEVGVLIKLECFVDSITYEQGTTNAKALDLRKRPKRNVQP